MTTSKGWEGILAKDERILWQGRPQRGINWRDLIGPLLPFGAIFTGFSIFWIAGAAMLSGQAPFPFSLFPLFGLPFLAVGLYMMGGFVVFDAYMRSVTWYTLTNRTAFIATNAFGKRQLKSYPVSQMPFLDLVDGVPGDILFADGSARRGVNGVHRTHPARIGFRRIEGARELYREMRNLREAARETDTS